MPLKLTLKPGERIIIGGAVLSNGSSVAHLLVENNVPVLRQKDILTEVQATSPCRRIYLVIQLMYIGDGLTPELSQVYLELVRDVTSAAPSTNDLISQITAYIVDSNFYPALKISKELITYEEELLTHATKLG